MVRTEKVHFLIYTQRQRVKKNNWNHQKDVGYKPIKCNTINKCGIKSQDRIIRFKR